ncbi:hypothetical protein EVAR_74562_1 [Eumeta japonica]|uniref:Uncharacterized protein n=1 Tax=Eumeta variegata TaxID=151549 RepID=A0A4C1TF64_EUMVA|nr:hypothetical protein EVAR_74562_1 [Eumeta japonica]
MQYSVFASETCVMFTYLWFSPVRDPLEARFGVARAAGPAAGTVPQPNGGGAGDADTPMLFIDLLPVNADPFRTPPRAECGGRVFTTKPGQSLGRRGPRGAAAV